MRYFEVKVQSDSTFKSTYWVEADNLISDNEIRDYIAQVATIDALDSDNDNIEEIEVLDPRELSNEEIFDIIADVRVRSKLIITALNNLDNVVLGIYHYEDDYSPDQSEFFIFSATAGQDADVTAIGKTDIDMTREKVINEGWIDCISQLKRYFQVPGVIIATGIFTIQTTSKEEYDMERADREVVLV